MNQLSALPFCKFAVLSGLVTPAEIDQVISQLRAVGKLPPEEAPHHPSHALAIANRMVEIGKLTPYQAEQLAAGRAKLTLGPYRIIDSIGQGGMGQVFKAEHSMMGRVVAIKVLPRSRSTPDAIANFNREVRTQAQLDHNNLVRAYDAGHDGNVYFLVTEYVPGMDLRHYVRNRGPLSMQEAATIISQAAAGLSHAHQRGLIHRDVKPGNLLVTPEGHTKVSDLGLAGWLSEADSDPRASKIVGTADYLSPEQIISPKNITTTSDIYSLGCTLYYTVTGKVPYPGGTARDKARRHCEATPLHPRRLNPGLSEDFVEVIAAMMEKNPAARIQTTDDVIDRLLPWAGDSVPAPNLSAANDSMADFAFDVASPLEAFDAPPGYGDFSGSHPALEDSLSQLSQGTEPFAANSEDTIPFGAPISKLRHRRRIPGYVWVIAPAAVMAILVLLFIIISSMVGA